MPPLFRHQNRLYAVAGENGGPRTTMVLDPWRWSAAAHSAPRAGTAIDAAHAIAWLHRERLCRLVPVAVVGPRNPAQASMETARALGGALGALAVPVVCGAKTGVMAAASEGAARAGSLVVGMVPDNEWDAANPFVTLPLATGLGPARNILIARSCLAMVAVGGQYGTITEVAYALHFSRPVFGLSGAPDILGVTHLATVEDVIAALLPILLRLPEPDS